MNNLEVINGQLHYYASRWGLELDERRVLGWCFAQAVLSAIWTIEDGGSDEELSRILRLAEATLTLLI